MGKTGDLRPNPGLFKDYARPGQFEDTRVAALECLVDYVKLEGKYDDLCFLLDLIEKDPVPSIRHKAVRLLIKTPPFEKGRHHRNDSYKLVERLWCLINSQFWYDSRLRCDIVDLYYTLYGRRRPPSLPAPELAALGRPQGSMGPPWKRDKGGQQFVIPRGEKREREEPLVTVKEEPREVKQELDERAGNFFGSGMEVPDFFAEDSNTGDGFDGRRKKHKKDKKKKKKHKHKKDERSERDVGRGIGGFAGSGFPEFSEFGDSISRGVISSGGSSSGSNPNSPAGSDMM